MSLATVGRGFGGAASEFHGFIKVAIGVVDGGHPGEGFGVLRVAIEARLGDAGELAEVSLLEEGFAVSREGEGRGEKGEQENGAESERKHRTRHHVKNLSMHHLSNGARHSTQNITSRGVSDGA